MESYSLSVCLTDLEGAQIQNYANGEQYVAIPIKAADLFLSDKGKVYLNLNLWANKSGMPDQYGKTHCVKQNFSKEKSEALKASGAKTPFIGSGKPIGMKNTQPPMQQQNVYQQMPPQGYAPAGYPPQPYQPAPQNNMYPQGAPTYNPNPTSEMSF